MVKLATQQEMENLIKDWQKDYRVAAPVLKKRGNKERVEYDFVEEWGEIFLERQPDTSPKKFFLPQNERLTPGTDEEEKPLIVFGVRSCDLTGLKVLDDVFLHDNYVDTFYQQHYNQTTVIGFSCSGPEASCFCQGLGINPVENERAGIYLYQDGDNYWFRVFKQETASLLASLPEGNEEKLAELINNRQQSFPESKFQLELPVPLPEKELFNSPVWEKLADKCLGCGVCTYYCTTCYCFGFFWEAENKNRSWDSCMFALYTKHASGHNPRQEKHQRYRQRIMHKYSYHPQNYGDLACTGCGRCIKNCPVKLDIRKALTMIGDYLGSEGESKNE